MKKEEMSFLLKLIIAEAFKEGIKWKDERRDSTVEWAIDFAAQSYAETRLREWS